ncbi:TPA: hypothetical protein I4G92_11660 [Enterobacter hormaechei subsp. xiangfangensis]|nr:hypothetical protein [Enterobacter hormaechei subsp. xiangfangensis]
MNGSGESRSSSSRWRLITAHNAVTSSSAHWWSMSFTILPRPPMISARQSSIKRPGSQCSPCAATTSKNSLVSYVDTVPVKKYRSSLMRPMRQRKLLTSI